MQPRCSPPRPPASTHPPLLACGAAAGHECAWAGGALERGAWLHQAKPHRSTGLGFAAAAAAAAAACLQAPHGECALGATEYNEDDRALAGDKGIPQDGGRQRSGIGRKQTGPIKFLGGGFAPGIRSTQGPPYRGQ
eukprot:1139060-Pelagomonas_calceolata.AAC.9